MKDGHWLTYWKSRLAKSRECYRQYGGAYQEQISGADLAQLHQLLVDLDTRPTLFDRLLGRQP